VVPHAHPIQIARSLPSVLAAAVLALGVVPCTAVFIAVNGVLLRPPAYDAPERVVALWESHPASGRLHEGVSPLNYRDWSEASQTIEAFALWESRSTVLRGDVEPLQVRAVRATPELFSVVGAQARLGRTFGHAFEPTEAVVVISDGLWQRSFGADPRILGRTIVLDEVSYQIIGVMPRAFQFPPGLAIDVWLPAQIPAGEWRVRSARRYRAVGRLAANATLGAAADEMTSIAKRLADEHPASNDGWTVVLASLRETDRERAAPLLVLLGCATLVFVLAAFTAVGLLTIREIGRIHEVAVRAALGGSPGRLVVESIARSGAPVTGACLLGTLLAVPLTPWLFALETRSLVGDYALDVDGRVVGFGVLLLTATAAIGSVVPAWIGTRVDLAAVLGGRSDAARQNRNMLRVRRLVSTVQVAVTVVLLTGAGLMGQSVWRLLDRDPGFRSDGVLAVTVSLPSQAFGARAARFYDEVVTKVRALPAVHAAAVVTALPMNPTEMDEFELPYHFEGEPALDEEAMPRVQFRSVSSGYFATLSRPLVAGRDFTAADEEPRSPIRAIVSESIVRRHLPNRDPIGARIRLPFGGSHEIIGVTNDVLFHGLDDVPRAEIFVPYRRRAFPAAHVIVRGDQSASALAPAVMAIVRSTDPSIPIARMAPLSELVADTAATRRFALVALGMLAVIAWLVGLLGTYGLVAHGAIVRSGELAVRAALGARPVQLLGLTIREGLVVAAVGVFLGLVAAAALSVFLASVLFDTAPRDPVTLLMAALVQLGTAVLAAWWPARSMAQANPAAILT